MTPDLLGATAHHVALARREETALGRKLDTGRFGATAAADPWPEHDLTLCCSYWREANKEWLYAAACLLDALLGGDRP